MQMYKWKWITFQKKTLPHSHVDCRPIPSTCAQREDKRAETIPPDDSPGNTRWSVSIHCSTPHTASGPLAGCRLTTPRSRPADPPQPPRLRLQKHQPTTRAAQTVWKSQQTNSGHNPLVRWAKHVLCVFSTNSKQYRWEHIGPAANSPSTSSSFLDFPCQQLPVGRHLVPNSDRILSVK